MAKIDIYSRDSKAVKTAELNDAVFAIEPNQQAMYDAALCYLAGIRQGTHSTLTRSFVSGTGRKPFKQKGTGRARQGSTRATQWRHGAVAFGPHPRKYGFKLNRKVRQLALRSALSEKLLESSLTVVENLNFEEARTKQALSMLKAFGFEHKTLLIADASEDYDNAYLAFRNIPNALVVDVRSLNVYDIMNADRLVFTEKAAETAGEVFA